MNPRVGIIDYGMGNLHSVAKALAVAGAETRLVASPGGMNDLDAIVLPGVGNFGEAMDRLNAAGFPDPLRDWMKTGRPFLGICLGMQVLFESSEEAPDRAGLGWFAGNVRLFPSEIEGKRLTVPAMGWNIIRPRADLASTLNPDNAAEPRYYFVHSYYCAPADPAVTAALTTYGIEYTAAVGQGRILATQFHPEKSGDRGLALLTRFVSDASVSGASVTDAALHGSEERKVDSR